MFTKKSRKPQLVTVARIWDNEFYNALTDLIRYRDLWFCVFRQGSAHVGGDCGSIQVLASPDARIWESVAFLNLEGVDLRDPKLSITPEGQLMLLLGGTRYTEDGVYIDRQSLVSFSEDGLEWSELTYILERHDWLWRVTWHEGVGWGVSYRFSDPTNKKQEWLVSLHRTHDGLTYEKVAQWPIHGFPNEATVRFSDDGEGIILLRRDRRGDSNAWLGRSQKPYTDWSWAPLNLYFGGPNFLILPDETAWAAGRVIARCPWGLFEKTMIAVLSSEKLLPQLVLPSGGDCSYPGMVYHDGFLWVSYYSSHQEHTAIYLAQIDLNPGTF